MVTSSAPSVAPNSASARPSVTMVLAIGSNARARAKLKPLARITGRLPNRVAKMPVANTGRAQQTGETQGFWKVLVGPDDRILGATIVGAAAAEVMAMIEIAMAGRLKYQVLQEMIFAHPTWAESLNNVFRELKPGK